MRESIESIKAELGKGKLVIRARQTGKTTALLEFVHERCAGFCYIFACNEVMADIMKRNYREMFPEDEQPIIKMAPSQLRGLGGRGILVEKNPRCWLTDEVWPSAEAIASDEVTGLKFLGGVGTPMSMDQHSGL